MITIYIMIYFSIFLHELMHYIVAKKIRIPIMKVKIGTEWPKINFGKWKVSPILGNSYVEVDYECLIKQSRVKISLFFVMGIIMNVFLTIIFFVLYKYMGQLSYIIVSLSNLFIVVSNLLPVGHTDIAELNAIIKEKNK